MSRRLISLIAALTIVLPVSIWALAPPSPDVWASTAEIDVTEYDEVASLPGEYQKFVLGNLPGHVRAVLWRTHIDRTLTEYGAALSAEQRAFLREVRTALPC